MVASRFSRFCRSIRRRGTLAGNRSVVAGRLGFSVICLLTVLAAVSASRAFAQSSRGESPASAGLQSVVTLRVYDDSGEEIGLGSGFVLQDGRIATNAHVVGGASWIEVLDRQGQFLGNVTYAEGISTSLDLAILPAIQGMRPGLPLASGEPDPGDPVWVIGSPMGLGGSVSTGVVSAVRSVDGRNLVQITAPISTGSSGGPILDNEGNVIGVTVSFMDKGQNLNFGVPARDLAALSRSAPGRFDFPRGSLASSSREADPSDDRSSAAERARAIDRAAEEVQLDSLTNGSLVPGQDIETDGKYVDLYKFHGVEGQRITVVLISDVFDTFLRVVSLDDYLSDESDYWARENDDSGEDTHSFLELNLPRSGEYIAAVTSYEEGATGSYTLLVAHGSAEQLRERFAESPEDRWTYIGMTADSASVYIDSETLDVNGHRALAWIRTLYPRVQSSAWKDAYDEYKVRGEFDCRRRRYRFGSAVLYLNDSVVRTVDLDIEWMTVVPGSVGEMQFDAVCSRG